MVYKWFMTARLIGRGLVSGWSEDERSLNAPMRFFALRDLSRGVFVAQMPDRARSRRLRQLIQHPVSRALGELCCRQILTGRITFLMSSGFTVGHTTVPDETDEETPVFVLAS